MLLARTYCRTIICAHSRRAICSSSSQVQQRRAAVHEFFRMYSDGRASEADKLMLTEDAQWEIYPSSVGSRVGGALTKDQHIGMMATTLESFDTFEIDTFDMACEDHVSASSMPPASRRLVPLADSELPRRPTDRSYQRAIEGGSQDPRGLWPGVCIHVPVHAREHVESGFGEGVRGQRLHPRLLRKAPCSSRGGAV